MRLVFLGGDRRYDVLTDEARAAGWPVLHAQPEDGPRPLAPWSEAPWEETLWLFPIPSCVRREGRWTVKGWNDPPAETFFSWVRAKDIVVYAAPDEGMAHMIEAGCEPARCANLLERHDFLYKNAMLTVEGALRMAADETGRAFWRSNCLVVGYGRIGKMLSGLEKQVLLRYLEGKSYQEISAEMHRHVKSIDNALQRVKRKLERFLSETKAQEDD